LLSCSGNSANKKAIVPAIPVTVSNVSLVEAVFYNSYPGNITSLKR